MPMGMDQPTPTFIMFETLKDFGSLSYKDLAGIILTDRPVYDGRSPRSRIDDKTWVSRYLVHAPLGAVPEQFFTDFGTSARTLANQLKSGRGMQRTNGEIIDHFGFSVAETMKRSLDAYGLDGAIYLNVLRRIVGMRDEGEAAIVDLLLLHFLVTGCTGDARRAADYTLEFAQNTLGVSFRTRMPAAIDVEEDLEEREIYLCLFRIQDGRLKGAPYYLNPGEDGTEIGSLATKQYSINDVEDTVSGHHLAIWRDGRGTWYAEGLGSKNGTVLVSGADRSEIVIEPPRRSGDGFVSKPVEIRPSDELVLARDTVFMVMEGVAE